MHGQLAASDYKPVEIYVSRRSRPTSTELSGRYEYFGKGGGYGMGDGHGPRQRRTAAAMRQARHDGGAAGGDGRGSSRDDAEEGEAERE